MCEYNDVPVFNSKEGKALLAELTKQIGKPTDMLEISVLSTVNLLVNLPEPVCSAIISPIISMPLLINHEDTMVKLIAKMRLATGV